MTTGSTFRLETGETVEAKVKFRFPKCPPGAYAAELIYIYDGDRENGDLIWGEYHGDPIAFQVSTRKK